MGKKQLLSETVLVNGVNLHYLDWGGVGPALILLAGWGCGSYIFSQFAPRFSDRFRVIAVDRRGHGDSDYPESGYDLETLTGDLRGFLDALGIERATFAGHSLAGIELSNLATNDPQRVDKLVYLDAAFEYGQPEYKAMMSKNPMRDLGLPALAPAYDTPEEYETDILRCFPSLAAVWGPALHTDFLHEIKTNEDGKVVDRMSGTIHAAIQQTVDSYLMAPEPIQAPVLSFFCLQDGRYFISEELMSPDQQARLLAWFQQDRLPYLRGWIEEFRRRVPHARVVEIPGGHHYCFLAHEEVIINEMREFLET